MSHINGDTAIPHSDRMRGNEGASAAPLPESATDARKPAAPSMCREEADVAYVGVFDGEGSRSGSSWFPEGWLPDGYDEVLDEGGVGAVWQTYGEDFACDEFGLPTVLGDALVAVAAMKGES